MHKRTILAVVGLVSFAVLTVLFRVNGRGDVLAISLAVSTPGPGAMTVYAVTNPNSASIAVHHVITDTASFRHEFTSTVAANSTVDYHVRDMASVPNPFVGAMTLDSDMPFTADVAGYDYPGSPTAPPTSTPTGTVTPNVSPSNTPTPTTTRTPTSANTATPSVTRTTTPTTTPASTATAYALNAGGPSYMTWAADQPYTAGGGGYIGGRPYSVGTAIGGTTDQVLYQTERCCFTSYQFDLPNGNYNVELRFAEIYYSGPGRRVFDVSINGAKVLANYDIYARVGAYAADNYLFSTTVSTGTLRVDFTAHVDYPKISAIKVWPATAPTATATPTVTPTATPVISPACRSDINGNGVVDVQDVQAVAGRWNALAGDPLYDAKYDLNGDGRIDVSDVQSVAGNWGKTCP
ncbi:MAG: malectin domain-containing carbohydrate-binding protein [Chloroflexi bacterium]|nr:malectin domain-containing carbohydrate-binding protein [Chloroflexota bacterium]